jgi:hypothetical protein
MLVGWAPVYPALRLRADFGAAGNPDDAPGWAAKGFFMLEHLLAKVLGDPKVVSD